MKTKFDISRSTVVSIASVPSRMYQSKYSDLWSKLAAIKHDSSLKLPRLEPQQMQKIYSAARIFLRNKSELYLRSRHTPDATYLWLEKRKQARGS